MTKYIDPGLKAHIDYSWFFFLLPSRTSEPATKYKDLGLIAYIDYSSAFDPLPSPTSHLICRPRTKHIYTLFFILLSTAEPNETQFIHLELNAYIDYSPPFFRLPSQASR